jgi:hypothetical protein
LQAAAAARIERIISAPKYTIHDAAKDGKAGLVLDYIVADPADVHAKNNRFLGEYVVCLCSFFENYSVNPFSIVASNNF